MVETIINVRIVVAHPPDVDPMDVVDRVLDNGTFQDALVEYAQDMVTPKFEVTSATAKEE